MWNQYDLPLFENFVNIFNFSKLTVGNNLFVKYLRSANIFHTYYLPEIVTISCCIHMYNNRKSTHDMNILNSDLVSSGGNSR